MVNAKYLSYPRAVGFGPTGSGRDSVPFGVSGHRIYLACLDDSGVVAGHATYTWSITNGSLRFTHRGAVQGSGATRPDRDPREPSVAESMKGATMIEQLSSARL